MSIVRKSKFRHVWAEQPRTEENWSNIRLTNEAWDSNFCAVNPRWIAIPWYVGGGGAVGILNVLEPGKQQDVPLLTGHEGAVLDLDWNPFYDNVIASSSNDGTCKIWEIPGTPVPTSECKQNLLGHDKKVGTCKWNPVAENIIATSSADFMVNIYDIRNSSPVLTVAGHEGLISSCEWNYDGSLLATACKDKTLRLLDPRSQAIIGSHNRKTIQGTKGNRCIWLGKRNYIFSCGFGSTNQRQFEVYDPRNLEEPVVKSTKLDSGSGMLMPFYDMDTDILYIAGKGDGNVRYYELVFGDENVTVNYIEQFGSNVPTNGCGFMPKRGCDVSVYEVAKLFKVTPDTVFPLSFRVPRKNSSFDEEIFPPCSSDEPALHAEQWLGGENSMPRTVSLEGGYVPSNRSMDTDFVKTEVEKEPAGEELLRQWRAQKDRIAFLEAELAKHN